MKNGFPDGFSHEISGGKGKSTGKRGFSHESVDFLMKDGKNTVFDRENTWVIFHGNVV